MRNIGQRLARIELGRHQPDMIIVRRALFEEMNAESLEQYRADVRRILANPRGTVLIFGDALAALFEHDPPAAGPSVTIERAYGI